MARPTTKPRLKRNRRASSTSEPDEQHPTNDHHHHHVYVVFLRNPKGDGKAGYYVGMTGLTPENRFQNHKEGVKAARIVRKYGERLVPRLYQHLNPMPYQQAKAMELTLADSLRKRGYVVFGGH